MDIQEGNYVSTVWFFSGSNLDIVFNLWRPLPRGLWRLEHRIRWYQDRKVFDSDDNKQFTEFTFPEMLTERVAVQKVEQALDGYIREVLAHPRAPKDATFEKIVIEIHSDDPAVFIKNMQEKGEQVFSHTSQPQPAAGLVTVTNQADLAWNRVCLYHELRELMVKLPDPRMSWKSDNPWSVGLWWLQDYSRPEWGHVMLYANLDWKDQFDAVIKHLQSAIKRHEMMTAGVKFITRTDPITAIPDYIREF